MPLKLNHSVNLYTSLSCNKIKISHFKNRKKIWMNMEKNPLKYKNAKKKVKS